MFPPSESDRTTTVILKSMGYDYKAMHVTADNPNLFMGIGLWSHRHGLSKGLPVDVVYLLLFANLLRAKIMAEGVTKSSTFTIILGDSMAITAAATSEKKTVNEEDISRLLPTYISSLTFLINLLNMREYTKIVLASDIVKRAEYIGIEKKLNENFATHQDPDLQKLPKDEGRFPYYLSQTAVVHYMHCCEGAGIKISWINGKSRLFINQISRFAEAPARDELAFDALYQQMYGEKARMQFAYTKAGLQQFRQRSTEVSEVPPYMAYVDNNYVRHVVGEKDVYRPKSLPRRIRARFNEISIIVRNMEEASLLQIDSALLTKNNFIQHCMNGPDDVLPISQIEADETLSSRISRLK